MIETRSGSSFFQYSSNIDSGASPSEQNFPRGNKPIGELLDSLDPVDRNAALLRLLAETPAENLGDPAFLPEQEYPSFEKGPPSMHEYYVVQSRKQSMTTGRVSPMQTRPLSGDIVGINHLTYRNIFGMLRRIDESDFPESLSREFGIRPISQERFRQIRQETLALVIINSGEHLVEWEINARIDLAANRTGGQTSVMYEEAHRTLLNHIFGNELGSNPLEVAEILDVFTLPGESIEINELQESMGLVWQQILDYPNLLYDDPRLATFPAFLSYRNMILKIVKEGKIIDKANLFKIIDEIDQYERYQNTQIYPIVQTRLDRLTQSRVDVQSMIGDLRMASIKQSERDKQDNNV